jgi:diacylglycerol O-acyltransferase / wax synthase
MQSTRLTPLDATFLELEDADVTAHMHIGATLVFRPPAGGRAPGVHELRNAIEPRLPALPLYRCRLSEPKPGRLHWPHWVEDANFDLSLHVREAALPAPGGREQLYEWAAAYWSERLDRDRPLWEMTLVTGLEGGCWAICTKTHHCLVDGVGSVDAAYLLLDTEPDVHPAPPAEGLANDRNGSSLLFRAPAAIAHGARAGIDAALHPSKLLDALARSRAMAELVARDELVAAPRTTLNVPIGVHRRFDVVRVPLADVKLIKNRLGGTVNDVVLAAATAGLRELLVARGDEPPPEGLRAMIPVNIRTAGDKLGNRISSLFVHLPVAESNPLQRYVHTVDHAEADKSGEQARGSETLVGLAGFAPPVLHSFLARSLFASRLFNVTITNVPGPQQPLYACGSRMTAVFPLVPLAADHSVGIAVVSYDGDLYFGLIGDRDSTRDLDVLSYGIARAIAELRELAATRSSGELAAPASGS